ncbi:hypothetical protein JNJ66_06990 [Candidatus Saccharibacteria bacterium]|nr:hypothetical protein [Candidatus Saccharibacteria bacterium]
MNTLIKKIAVSAAALAVVSLVAAVAVQAPVQALNVFEPACGEAPVDSAICGGSGDRLFGQGSIWSNVLKAITFLIGAAAVIMLLYGGFRYVASGGDQSAITAAKNTIFYAIVGIIVAIMAAGIVTFVVDAL